MAEESWKEGGKCRLSPCACLCSQAGSPLSLLAFLIQRKRTLTQSNPDCPSSSPPRGLRGGHHGRGGEEEGQSGLLCVSVLLRSEARERVVTLPDCTGAGTRRKAKASFAFSFQLSCACVDLCLPVCQYVLVDKVDLPVYVVGILLY